MVPLNSRSRILYRWDLKRKIARREDGGSSELGDSSHLVFSYAATENLENKIRSLSKSGHRALDA